MRTDDLTEMLARNAAAEPRGRPDRWWLAAVAGATLVTVAIMLGWLGLQPRLLRVFGDPQWWGKAGFGFAMAMVGLLACWRLGRPGEGRLSLVWAFGPLALLWAVALLQLGTAPETLRLDLVLGRTWRGCSMRVAALSIPALLAAIWVLRRMAPTRPALAGAAAGLFAGGVGATVYAFHCPELAPAFVGVWYVLGVAIPTALGAIIGPRALRW